MKSLKIVQFLLLVAQVFLVSTQEIELSDEPSKKWDIDLNDMFEFTKSFAFRTGDNTGQIREERPESLSEEYQLQLVNDNMRILKNFDLLQSQTKQYIKRFINLFLVKCGLQDVPESDKDIKLDLEFFITKEDLTFLQNFSKDLSKMNVQDSLQRLDSIFDRGLQLKEESLYEKSWSFMNYIVEAISIPPSWYYSKIFYYVVVLLVTLILSVIIKLNTTSNVLILLTVYNNLIILEGILNYLNQLKEAKVEDHVRILRAHTNSADACDPSKQSWWSHITGWFWQDDCLTYHLTFTKSKAEELSPLKCLLDAYEMYLFQYPFKVIGSVIRVFSENLFATMPFKNYVSVFGYVWIFPFLLILIILLMKPRMRFSFFGAGVDVGFSDRDFIQRKSEFEAVMDRRIQELRDRQSSNARSATGTEMSLGMKGEDSVECIGRESCSELEEKRIGGREEWWRIEGENGKEGIVKENGESRQTLLDDISTAKEIVKEIEKMNEFEGDVNR